MSALLPPCRDGLGYAIRLVLTVSYQIRILSPQPIDHSNKKPNKEGNSQI